MSTEEKPTRLLYLVPIFMSLLGGVLMYIAVKDKNQEMANDGMFVGVLSFMAQVAVFILIWYVQIKILSDFPSFMFP